MKTTPAAPAERGQRVILLSPPFSRMDSPGMSIPVLAAFLKECGISVAAYDLNQCFWRHFLTAERIVESHGYAVGRLRALNDETALSFRKRAEYSRLVSVFHSAQRVASTDLRHEIANTDWDHVGDSPALASIIGLAMSPHFPNNLSLFPAMRLNSAYDEFSSDDIVESTGQRFFYSDILEDALLKVCEDHGEARLVGLSVVYGSQVLPAFFCAAVLKRRRPDLHVCMGGPFITQHFRELTNERVFDVLDSLILDEGEIPLKRLHAEVTGDTPDLSSVPTLIWFDGDRVIRNESSDTPPSLANMPTPDYRVFPLDDYIVSKPNMQLPFRLSRGCSWRRCTFCRTDLSLCSHYEQAPPERLCEQLIEMIEATGIRNVFFADESADPAVLECVARQLLKTGLSVKWQAVGRFDKGLTEQCAERLRRSGCEGLFLGLEAHNDRILRLMKKGITTRLVDQVLAQIDGKIPVTVLMIIGFPSETEEEARQGFEAVTRFKQDGWIRFCNYAVFQLLYGSAIWRSPGTFGVRDIHVRPNQDLCPDVERFKSDGMSRQTVYKLSMRFLGSLLPDYRKLTSLPVNGERIGLSHDVNALMQEIRSVAYLARSMPYEAWLQECEALLNATGTPENSAPAP